jgi:hypothetical protein
MGHPAIDRRADDCARRYVPHLNPLRRTSVIGRTPDWGDEITQPPYFDLSGVPRNPRSVR